mmetsp:Transcript_36673/g.85709  ORF Transcript_36673/g.85709 Transcript_36673/m.85709 type:complete len:152 (-) Transcript_36673:156-611(-)
MDWIVLRRQYNVQPTSIALETNCTKNLTPGLVLLRHENRTTVPNPQRPEISDDISDKRTNIKRGTGSTAVKQRAGRKNGRRSIATCKGGGVCGDVPVAEDSSKENRSCLLDLDVVSRFRFRARPWDLAHEIHHFGDLPLRSGTISVVWSCL